MRKTKNYELPPLPTRLSDVVRREDLILNFRGTDNTLDQSVDLSTLTARPRLVADFAVALRHHLADKSQQTRAKVRSHLRRFLHFLEQHDPSQARILSARDVDGRVLQAFIIWLGSRETTKGSQSVVWTTIKMTMAWLQRHRPDLVQPGLELPFNPFPSRNRGTRPRLALAREEIEAVLKACRQDIEATWADFQRGSELLAAADSKAPPTDDPTLHDLSNLSTLLAVLQQRHGSLLPEDGELLTMDRLSRRVRHMVTYHGGAEQVSRFLHATSESILPYMIAIGAQLFINAEALRAMRRDCASEDPLIERLVHVTWRKGRSGRMQRRSLLRDRSMSVPNLIDQVIALTTPLVPHARPEERNKLFLAIARRGRRVSANRIGPALCRPDAVRRFVARHGLLNQHGEPLRLTLAFLRPTGLTHAHSWLNHDLIRTQALAGHANLNLTAHYVAQPIIQAEQTAMLARLQGRFVEVVRAGGSNLQSTRDEAPEEELDTRNATASGFICRDPLAGTAPGQRRGQLCTAWLGCFTCRNAVIPRGPETLAQILRVRTALTEARSSMSLDRWRLLYAPKLEIIERDILPEFSNEVHAAAAVFAGKLPTLPLIE